MSQHTAVLLVHTTAPMMAAEPSSTAGTTLFLSVIVAVVGVYVALRVVAVVTAVIQSLVRVALTVGTTVLVIGFFVSLVGITYLTRSVGL